jgi:hypothetical protein
VLAFFSADWRDSATAEHLGYERLAAGRVTHRRAATLHRRERFWLVTDVLTGAGEHEFRFVFHAAPGREVRAGGASAEILDPATGARLLVVSLEGLGGLTVEPRRASRGYGSKVETAAAVWTLRAAVPLVARWLLLPVCAGEDAAARLELVARVRDEWGADEDSEGGPVSDEASEGASVR